VRTEHRTFTWFSDYHMVFGHGQSTNFVEKTVVKELVHTVPTDDDRRHFLRVARRNWSDSANRAPHFHMVFGLSHGFRPWTDDEFCGKNCRERARNVTESCVREKVARILLP